MVRDYCEHYYSIVSDGKSLACAFTLVIWLVTKVGCRSQFFPVCQYSKDKPDKYRFVFFILADSHSYAILHMDVYQCQNAENAFIYEIVKRLPTTMNAVMNAVYQLGLKNDVEYGRRLITIDNWYQLPELAMILQDRSRINYNRDKHTQYNTAIQLFVHSGMYMEYQGKYSTQQD